MITSNERQWCEHFYIVGERWLKMSQIRKSASFRSRIPIRRAKPTPRRCYSPEPYRRRNHSAMLDQSHNDDEHLHRPHRHQSVYGDKQDQRHTKLKLKRQRHLASTVAHHTQNKPNGSINDNNTNNSMASTRPKTIYSSSSYSSSDESQESEAPIQVNFNIFILNAKNNAFRWHLSNSLNWTEEIYHGL